jgi:hypothetical protein
MPAATEGAYHPHPVVPFPRGEGRIVPVMTATFPTPLPAGEGSGVRHTCSAVALAIVSRPRVVTPLNPSPEYQFLDASQVSAERCCHREHLVLETRIRNGCGTVWVTVWQFSRANFAQNGRDGVTQVVERLTFDVVPGPTTAFGLRRLRQVVAEQSACRASNSSARPLP